MPRLQKSKSDSGTTPLWVKEYIQKEFGDVNEMCPFNPVFDEIINQDTDALKIDWISPVYINPPYSNWRPFVKRGFELWKSKKIESIFLLKTDHLCSPLVTENADNCEIRLFNKRLRFGGYKNYSPFTSVLLIINGRRPTHFSLINVKRKSK